MEMMKIGDRFKNILGEVNELVKISPTALVVHAKNVATGEVNRYRFYEASGNYIDTQKHSIRALGHPIDANGSLIY
jgi:ribosomal protein L10